MDTDATSAATLTVGLSDETATRPRRGGQLRDLIEAAIASGDFPPGMRLEETALAQRFNVSRTPVREALLQLASTGLVEMRPRQGAVVASLTLQDMMEMFEVMAELEALCAELAARRITEAELTTLRALHESCRALAEAGDPDRYYEENRRFHEVIYGASRNRFLEEQTRTIRNRVGAYRRIQLHHRGRLQRSWGEHDEVVQAIAAGDAQAAREATRRHVAVQGDTFMDFIATLPPSYMRTQAG